jgi:putative FmdB family regulatory protein
MPTYQYRCQKCGWQFEREQSMKEKALKRCPKCRGVVQRVITGGEGFLFKGGSPTPTYTKNSAAVSSCCGTDSPCSDPKRCCGR